MEKQGSTDRDHLLTKQIVRYGPRPHRIAEMDGRIERCIDEHERLVARRQVERDVRMLRLEIGEPGDQPAGRKSGDDSQLKNPAGTAMRHQRQGIVFDLFQTLTTLFSIDLAGARECHPLFDAIEQLYAELVFQRRYLPAHRALRQ